MKTANFWLGFIKRKIGAGDAQYLHSNNCKKLFLSTFQRYSLVVPIQKISNSFNKAICRSFSQ
jgi:hypothetical protein